MKQFAIDLPNPYDPESPMITYEYYKTYAEALKAAKRHFGADNNGNINIISEIDDGEYDTDQEEEE